MDDPIDEMLIEVRASTQGFAADVARMRATVDSQLVSGFGRAGDVLERGLLSAIRKGSLGFEDLRRTALSVIDQVAAQALKLGLDGLLGGTAKSGAGGILGSLLGGLLGLPGRATGGPVSPGSGYLVGERGPELFVPTSAGRVLPAADRREGARQVSVDIRLAQPNRTDSPVALRQSGRQVAAAVRRALLG
ncbi:tail tape measure protein [Erythrobacter sp. 3-20A1M]|uniref:tail tape measure protein n=1 Tax=Erythrobacter sp. 3-20A1M TaxID=2653850 RepID=UPI001BFC2B88|nr:tail tape measure protein [Erythrobacter sp. 3-20A1M]QWC56927.1 tail tape measure protein [Erythrobacter sp. 3-20A1M]